MYSERTLNEILQQAENAAKAREYEKTLGLCDEVLADDPKNLRAWDLKGFVAYFLGRFDDSLQACRQALTIKPDHPYALKGLGLNLAQRAEMDEALEAFEKCVQLRPKWFDPYWDCAVALRQNQRLDEALAWLKRGVEAVPASEGRYEKFSSQLRAERDKALENSSS